MKKTLSYRLFGFGRIPKAARRSLEAEGVEVADEGMPGRFISKDFKAPGRRFKHRSEGFSGCLVLTKKRLICYTYWKRQINIGTDDPKLAQLYAQLNDPTSLSISFESSVFHEDWEGVLEFRFKTEKAREFHEALTALGMQDGHP